MEQSQEQIRQMQEDWQKEIAADRRMGFFLLIPGVLLAFVVAWFSSMKPEQIGKLLLLLIILEGILLFYMRSSYIWDKLTGKRGIVVAGYLISLILILSNPVVKPAISEGNVLSVIWELPGLWMLGPVLIAAMVDIGVGMLVNLIFVFLLSSLTGCDIDQMVYHFLLCALMTLLARYFTEWKNFLYCSVIVLCSDVTLLLMLSGFHYDSLYELRFAWLLVEPLLVMIVVFLLRRIINRQEETHLGEPYFLSDGSTQVFSMLEEREKELQTEEKNNPKQTDEECVLIQSMLKEDYPLLVQLKNENPSLYQHSMKIGELSFVAANMIGADENLARAGGYYHEIGRLISNNYIKEGIHLAKDLGFPKSVIDIMKQHNIKVGKPSTPEAALVMISDSVISSVEYMQNTSKENSGNAKPLHGKISAERLINGIFDARLLGGSLDQCGLSLTQYKTLKQFYVTAIRVELGEDK